MIARAPLAIALTASLALAACAAGPSVGPEPLTPTSRWTLQVEPGVDQIALAVREDALSVNQAAALDALTARHRARGVGAVSVAAPAGEDAAAARTAWNVRDALMARGLPAEAIRMAGYAAPDPRAPVIVSFETVEARVPACGRAWEDLSANSTRTPNNFGCAVTANMAAQIADPRDIQQPRAMPLQDSHRAVVVFDNYRQGRQTSAPQEELVSGRVTQAVE
ncbi:MAG TPA: CpaD family pilus assembly lipoprotein [Brevundimonas sp.]|jgi:pilus assembly protein CpaD|uniref:CpaD family pilus assembly lipoprotein n=1 Tax=Brevundimonas sp. TaxID=1871086 RepID=UPI002E0E5E81|nr:CpaD family pilus assembly lipoprotein [Brevundimonas sp.]